MESLPKSENLIDFGRKSSSGQGSVRVSVLEAFDPLLTEQNHSGEFGFVSHFHSLSFMANVILLSVYLLFFGNLSADISFSNM